jgi:hypothetical protein
MPTAASAGTVQQRVRPAVATGQASATRITSVAFSGTASAPTITIRGSGFGSLPSASPSGAPYHYQPGCSTQPAIGNKNDGHDYGANGLWMLWGRVQAGSYVSGSSGYLDCIGLVVKNYSASEIVFTLGCQYPYYAKLSNGTKVSVEVRGTKFNATVHFG